VFSFSDAIPIHTLFSRGRADDAPSNDARAAALLLTFTETLQEAGKKKWQVT
jgi:hypothetical protein